jgi:hypothetical protein
MPSNPDVKGREMKNIRVVGLCMVAVLAMSFAVAAGASAAVPERGKCASGKEFEDKGCTVSGAKDKFKWTPNVKTAFTSTSGAAVFGAFTPEGAALPPIECTASKTKGDFVGPKGSEFTTTFEGCTSAGERCTGGAKAKAGQIVTSRLEGTLGFISAGVVGEDVKAVGGGVIASARCGANEIVTDGSVIGEIASGVYNAAALTESEVFRATGGKQEPTKLEGQPEDTLKSEINNLGSGSFPFGATESVTMTGKPGLEIKTEEPPAAPKWWVAGKLLVGSEAIAETTTVTEPFKLQLHGEGGSGTFTIQCAVVRVKGGAIEAPSARSEKALVYEGCEVEGKPECAVGTTSTKPLKAQLEGSSGAETLKFEPENSKKEIAKWHVTQVAGKPPCAQVGFYEADGTMICGYPAVELESAEHPLEFTASSGSKVEVAGQPAGFIVTYKVHLASNKLWSAF